MFVIAVMTPRYEQQLRDRASAFHPAAVIDQFFDEVAGEDARGSSAIDLVKQTRIGQIEGIDQQRLALILGRHQGRQDVFYANDQFRMAHRYPWGAVIPLNRVLTKDR